jgi:hypothetical protein
MLQVSLIACATQALTDDDFTATFRQTRETVEMTSQRRRVSIKVIRLARATTPEKL